MKVAPVALTLPVSHNGPPVLGVGAFLKSTVTLIDGGQALVSADVGHLDTAESVRAFEETLKAFLDRASASPALVAHDLHPDFPSTRAALALGLPTLAVQHHHAHVGALAAEHGVDEPCLGLVLDGFGLGPDRAAWGGELLLIRGATMERLGHLSPLTQPGGDVAAREPWRMGAAALHALGRGGEIAGRWPDQPAAARLGQVLERGLNAPLTSSGGRLFDAACGLLDVHPVSSFEGQAPMALEALAVSPRVMDNGWIRQRDGNGCDILDMHPLLAALADLPRAHDEAGERRESGANLFHGTLSAALAEWVVAAVNRTGVRTVALGGGCFYNRVMSGLLVPVLESKGIKVLRATALVPGDQAVSLGQAWVASRYLHQIHS